MKKLFLMAVIAVFGLSSTYSQSDFEVGLNYGFPTGDAADISEFSIGLDIAYLYEVSEIFDIGAATGYSHAFGDEFKILGEKFEYDDIQFIPIAGAVRLNVTEALYIRGDVGYAIGINDGNDGGLYYRPRVGYAITDFIGVNLSYTGISLDGGDWSTFGVGVEFHL